MRNLEFKGITVEYDEHCVKSYRWQKAMNSGDSGRSTRAVSRLFDGKDEYYAYLLSAEKPMSYEEWAKLDDDVLDESMDAMGELLAEVLEDMGQTAKN